ncbi:gliding motility-associated C-terminal domain-containing protein [Spirosoma montaniterrae]|uniref:Cadherin domain-containing protein n=1 Tax=Spirosoma montaniterrae TaxID=1178516 RepID=A0A1P9WSK3_9BACT|nr:gliding motility-associated C-terminal domain-containing protein [Spirosoma montaniterrae]AQG78354.1 hypothetical protein AWR27_02790 [Spirosoma montaniterrae]
MLNLYCCRGRAFALTLLLLIINQIATATHIVGGELELRRQPTGSAYSHRVNLNLYFDDIYGDPGAEDPNVQVGVFARRNNQFIGYINLFRTGNELVPYTQNACQSAQLRTRLIRYAADLTFDPNVFNDPSGYYLSWERCCRNRNIVNIQNPGSAGSTFYLEFPAIGTANSSPVFVIPKGDYACIGQPFTLDFSATDADRDSLTYTLVTPYNGYSSDLPTNLRNPGFNGIFTPGPYPPINWITGLNVQNQIPGSQPLRVNARTGLLTVTPNRTGLHVFSVEVDEFRRGVRIGRVRRDYQVLVIDCPRNDPPQLLLRMDGQKTFMRKTAALTITEKDTNCLSLFVTDRNANQRISIINMSGSLPGLTLTPDVLLTRTGTDTLQAKFCFGKCVGGDGRPFTLRIRATDESCPQGLSDTLTIQLTVIPSPNDKPAATTNLVNNRATVQVGTPLSFTAFGADINNDNITIQAVGRGFALTQAGMSFTSGAGVGKVSQPFTWKPTCDAATRSEYVVDFIVTDTRCNRNLRDTVTVRLAAMGLPSQPPNIRTTLTQSAVDLTVSRSDTSGRSTFDVLGNDPDRDTLRMTATGRGFDMRGAGMSFSNQTGPPTLRSPFDWRPTCELMAGRTEATFVVDFVVDDRSCQPNRTDTTTVTFRVRDLSGSTDITVPNVFTPNGDGINDFFAVKNLPENGCLEQFKSVEITNRWGRVVFTSNDPKFRWFGTDSPLGTYYYLITTTKRTFKGMVSLIR